MGRGKVEVRKIENKTTRQVTFSKRRKGLMKKTQELAVLCDAQIGLIIFSSTGKKFEFCSDPLSMGHVIEEYLKFTGKRIPEHDNRDEIYKEWRRIKAETQALEQNLRLYSGEGLDFLTYQNLEQLEQQLEYSVNKIRARKNQLFEQQMENLNRKVMLLDEENSKLQEFVSKIREQETLMHGYNHQYDQSQIPPLEWKMQDQNLRSNGLIDHHQHQLMMRFADVEHVSGSNVNDHQNSAVVLQLADHLNSGYDHTQQQQQQLLSSQDATNVISNDLLTL